MKFFALAGLLSLLLLPPANKEYYLFVGTYDSPKSEGIYVYRFNSIDGSVKEVSHVKTANPSFLAIATSQQYVYAVNEIADSTGKGGQVTSFSFNKRTGLLTQLNQRSSQGNHPCYLTVDKTGKWVIAGNYSSGNFAVLPVKKDGSLGPAKQVIQHKGSGPNPQRQQGPHVHAVFLKANNYNLYVPDLGIDKIMVYRFDARTGTVYPSKPGYKQTPPGSGPRHIDVHPNGKFVYLAEELIGSIAVFSDFGNADLQDIQNISALPLTYKGSGATADIHVSPDGKFLYASNRDESNTIAIFSIDNKTGKLTLVDHQSTLGKTPRNFNFDPSGNYLLVANQNSDEIVIFKRDKQTGLLTDTGKRINVGKPVCIKWIKAG